MTVIENIILGPIKVQKRNKVRLWTGKTLLDRVGLLTAKLLSRQLSGGQKQNSDNKGSCMNLKSCV